MSKFTKFVGAALGLSLLTSAAFAGGHAQTPEAAAVKARQAHMGLYGFYLGQLGAMAKGDVEYNADVAKGVAGNLAALTAMDQRTLWPQGSDNGSVQGTRALPAIWENFPDVIAKVGAVNAAATALEATAGDGVEAIQAGLGAVGGACNACHKSYRAPQ